MYKKQAIDHDQRGLLSKAAVLFHYPGNSIICLSIAILDLNAPSFAVAEIRFYRPIRFFKNQTDFFSTYQDYEIDHIFQDRFVADGHHRRVIGGS